MRQFGARNGSQNFNSSVKCFKCGKKGHIKRHCKNALCQKYIEYCKKSCNNCQQKRHFAKDCQNEQAGETSSHKNKSNETNKGRRALISVGLSTANVNSIEADSNCIDFWYRTVLPLNT